MVHRSSIDWRTRVVAFVVMALGVGIASPVTAQSHWGVSATYTPKWTDFEQIRKVVIDSEGGFTGTQFTVGLVRGSHRGGDWGVHFVSQRISDTTSTEV